MSAICSEKKKGRQGKATSLIVFAEVMDAVNRPQAPAVPSIENAEDSLFSG
jgi:hypothetical protein